MTSTSFSRWEIHINELIAQKKQEENASSLAGLMDAFMAVDNFREED